MPDVDYSSSFRWIVIPLDAVMPLVVITHSVGQIELRPAVDIAIGQHDDELRLDALVRQVTLDTGRAGSLRLLLV